jgi:hypothetical protein
MSQTSLIDLLRQSLPVHAAWSAAQIRGRRGNAVPLARDLNEFLKIWPPDNIAMPRQSVPTTGTVNDQVARMKAFLWNWKMVASHDFRDIQCRVSARGYALQQVLNRLVFGYKGDPVVRVEFGKDVWINLPLTRDYLAAQFFSVAGYVPKGKYSLWPLEALFDSGTVMAFIYEPSVDAKGAVVAPLFKNGKCVGNWVNTLRVRGAGNWKPVRDEEYQLMKAMLQTVKHKNADGWLEMMTGPIMQQGFEAQQTAAKTSQTRTVGVTQPRVIVALSFGTCRERSDFEPGGLVGMSKIFPNIMVWSNVPVRTVASSIWFERPAKTWALDEGDGTVKGQCCNAYEELDSLLVADGNEIGEGPQLPFWGGTFSYVRGPANAYYGGQIMTIVDRRKARRKYPGGTRYLVRRGYNSMTLDTPRLSGVIKEAGQGEWDNIHVAPQLKLDLAQVSYSRTAVVPGDLLNPLRYKVDAAACQTDKIWMAPFCAHDCFHTHWRWGAAAATAEWTRGWDANGPYRVAGAPMIPINQNAWLQMTGTTSFYYHAAAYHNSHTPGELDIFMHHGSAYAQDVTAYWMTGMAMLNVFIEEPYYFYNSAGRMLGIKDMPFMYWLMRFTPYGEGATPLSWGQLKVRQRIAHTEAELEAMRKF